MPHTCRPLSLSSSIYFDNTSDCFMKAIAESKPSRSLSYSFFGVKHFALWHGSLTFRYQASGIRPWVPRPRCYAFGYRTMIEAKSTLLVFASSNMFLDLAIFIVPLTEYSRPNLMRKRMRAMTRLFSIGFMWISLTGSSKKASWRTRALYWWLHFAFWADSSTITAGYSCTIILFGCPKCSYSLVSKSTSPLSTLQFQSSGRHSRLCEVK